MRIHPRSQTKRVLLSQVCSSTCNIVHTWHSMSMRTHICTNYYTTTRSLLYPSFHQFILAFMYLPPSCTVTSYTGQANGSDARSLLGKKYKETLLPGGAHKLGVVFFHFWSAVVDMFVHANAQATLA